MKLFFYDLETTGVKHWKNGIWQIAGMVVIDGVVKEEFDLRIQPNPKCVIEDDALKVGGVTRENLASFMSFEKGYQSVIQILERYVDRYNKKDKFYLVGYNNAAFDDQFFRSFFLQHNDNYFNSWFWIDTLDAMRMASDRFKETRHTMVDFKLPTVARRLGIEVEDEKLHDALYDIHLTKSIYDILSYEEF